MSIMINDCGSPRERLTSPEVLVVILVLSFVVPLLWFLVFLSFGETDPGSCPCKGTGVGAALLLVVKHLHCIEIQTKCITANTS